MAGRAADDFRVLALTAAPGTDLPANTASIRLSLQAARPPAHGVFFALRWALPAALGTVQATQSRCKPRGR